MQYKAIIFDCFGVITDVVGPQWFNKYFPHTPVQELKDKYTERAYNATITEEELFTELSQIVPMMPEEIKKEWLEFAVVNKEIIPLIKKLKESYKTAVCSNAFSPFFREIFKKNDLSSIFDVIVVSSEEKSKKPEPKFFEVTLSKLGVKPEEAIFIDDKLRFVEAGERVGIKGFVFSNVEKLKKDLASIGIIV